MSNFTPNPFTLKVMEQIKRIPKGKVATYKQIAGLAGKPGASRGVSWILSSCSKKYKLPWQRVISSKGEIAFKWGTYKHRLQKHLLVKEGVSVSTDGQVDMTRHQWSKRPPRERPRPVLRRARG